MFWIHVAPFQYSSSNRVHELNAKALYALRNSSPPPNHNTQNAVMASVLHSSLPLCRHHTSSSKTTSTSVLGACHFSRTQKIYHFSTLHHKRNCNFKKGLICQSFIEPPEAAQSKDDFIGSLKIKLLVWILAFFFLFLLIFASWILMNFSLFDLLSESCEHALIVLSCGSFLNCVNS